MPSGYDGIFTLRKYGNKKLSRDLVHMSTSDPTFKKIIEKS
jgi:hypothetical protein